MKKRLLSLLSLLLVLTSLLSSCGGLPQPALLTVLKGSLAEIGDTVGNLTGKQQRLISGGTSRFDVVYSAEATTDEIAAATRLAAAIFQKTGVQLIVRDDSTRPADGGKEILVGKTARTLPDTLSGALNAANYVFAFDKKGNLLLRAENYLMTVAAVDHFIATYVEPASSGDYLSVPAELSYVAPTVSLLNDGTTDYKIVRSATADERTMALAAALSDAIRTKTGATVPVISDAQPEGEREILVGNTKRAASTAVTGTLNQTQYYVGAVGEQIVLNAKNSLMLEKAVAVFTEHIVAPHRPLSGEKKQLPLPAPFSLYHSENVLYFVNKGLSDFSIIYPAAASASVVSAVESLQAYIEGATGTRILALPDSEGTPDNDAFEILVGNTNRTASKESEQRNFPVNYYELSVVGNKILVGAYFEYTLIKALDALEEVLDALLEDQNAGLNASDPYDRVLFITDSYVMSGATAWAAAPPLANCAEPTALSSNRYRMQRQNATMSDFNDYIERLLADGFVKDTANSSSEKNVVYTTATAKAQVTLNSSNLLQVTVTPITKVS